LILEKNERFKNPLLLITIPFMVLVQTKKDIIRLFYLGG